MTAILGRKRRFSATVITGNGKGLIGYGRGLALEGKASVTQAKNKAIKRLVTFNFIEKGTGNLFFCSI